jgi:hypothetical protein
MAMWAHDNPVVSGCQLFSSTPTAAPAENVGIGEEQELIVFDLQQKYDQILSDAESLLGKQVGSFSLGRARFSDTDGARPCLVIENNHAVVELNKVARSNDLWAIWSLAHGHSALAG